jgi:hypothetical protein
VDKCVELTELTTYLLYEGVEFDEAISRGLSQGRLFVPSQMGLLAERARGPTTLLHLLISIESLQVDLGFING